ncbi:hypothetical protein EYE42_05800 [Paracoccus subflavus]|uniref:Uncharacterized protein n=1 Tax=Paracoccus subflavus TaxID=2528244 RepID=A0A4Q9G242_9RHOB|nr:hypothetical protein [Paracoccus subflavus]TBN41913.1 hypothetical protein EYE42_05800 [Paracoccus subflavus]
MAFRSHHPIRRETAKMEIIEVLRKAGGIATFEHLDSAIQGFSGSLWFHHEHLNCVLWKIDHNHAVALSGLLTTGIIRIEPAATTDYSSDKMATYVENGSPVAMPIADAAGVYSEPHWLPSKLILEIKEL